MASALKFFHDILTMTIKTMTDGGSSGIARHYGRGGGVAAIYSSNLAMAPKLDYNFKYFEVLVLNLIQPDRNCAKPLTTVTLYRPPGPDTEFIIEFSDFLPSLVIRKDTEQKR